MRPSGVFTVRDLSFSYDGEKTIFDGLDLSIREGVVTTLIGANGCGKSTLFNLMTKNLQPDSGDIYLRRGNVAQMSLRDFAQLVAIVHQNNIAPDDVTVEKLVEYGRFPFRAHGRSISPEEDEQMVAWALEAAGVSELAGQVASSLSGGQRQRVWIAMALAQGADVLLLDEPTTYLDVRYQIEILNLVHQLNVEYGMTVIMVLHDVNQALYYSDEIIALAHGEVVAQGRPADVVDERLLSEVYDVNLRILDIDGRPFVINVDEREGVCNPANEAFPDYLKTNQEVFMALRGQIETNASGYSASSSGRGLSESEIVGIAAAAATAAANAAVRVASSRSAVEGNGSSDFQKPVVNGDAIGSLASAKDSEPIRLEAGEEGVDPMPKTAPSRSFGEAGRGDAAESNADGSGLKDPTAAVARRSSSLPARPKGRAVPSGDAEQTLDGDGGPADGSSPAKSEVVKSKTGKKRPAVVRGAWAAGGFIAFALGAVGVVLPIIPTTPFMLLAAFCFARSSDKLNNWFKSTKLYHKVLEGYVTKRQMTVKAKLSIIVPVTLLMGFAAFMMRNALVPCIILGIVWAAHIVYFGFIVKTDKGDGSAAEDSDGNSATRKEGKGMPMIKTRLFELLSEAKKYIWYQVLWKLLALAAQIVIVF
ncbi:MAG: DUF454 family protein, partial [Eggerthellaceae bacterium]|nr:DUF454 family protein [Eggerthellaceae bacterium]